MYFAYYINFGYGEKHNDAKYQNHYYLSHLGNVGL